MEKMKFSLVTTCRNEIASVHRWKQNILEQTRQPEEIVIVDAFSDDGTAEVLYNWSKEDDRIIFIQEKGNAAFGRNQAISNSTNEHVVSTDLGVQIDSKWFEEIVKPFQDDPSTQIVIGSYAVDKNSIISAASRAEYYIEGDGIPIFNSNLISLNRSSAYKKEVWRDLGGLPEDLTLYADDSVFGRQMIFGGYKIAYAPKAITFWERPKKLKQFWKQEYGYGFGDGEAGIKTPFAFRLYKKKFIPSFLVPPLTGLRHSFKQMKRFRIKEALYNKDIIAIYLGPILSFGKGWYFAKGYLKGDIRGEKYCQSCRSRLPGRPHFRPFK